MMHPSAATIAMALGAFSKASAKSTSPCLTTAASRTGSPLRLADKLAPLPIVTTDGIGLVSTRLGGLPNPSQSGTHRTRAGPGLVGILAAAGRELPTIASPLP